MRKTALIALITGFVSAAWAQKTQTGINLELSTTLSEGMIVFADQGITLKPGFNTNGHSFSASIGDVSYAEYKKITPDADRNYIRTVLPQEGYTAQELENILAGTVTKTQDEIIENITYYDGLGRPSQELAVRQAPDYSDIVVLHQYDDLGREDKQYLPFTATNNGTFVDQNDPRYIQSMFYANSTEISIESPTAPYAVTIFDGSPLNRVMKQGGPGTTWQPVDDPVRLATEHVVSYIYGTNTTSETIYNLAVTSTGGLFKQGVLVNGSYQVVKYSPGTLYVTTTTDENGNQAKEYKDFQGKVILKSAYNAGQWLKTYYVYDDFDLLRFVVPPMAQSGLDSWPVPASGNITSATWLSGYCYYYEYDARKRMVQKKLPGADVVYMVYDDRDRLVLTQDGATRNSNAARWMFTVYDELNRPAVTGTVNITGTLAQIRTAFESPFFVTKSGTTNYTYSSLNFPATANVTCSSAITLTETYYDGYTFSGATQFSAYSATAGVTGAETQVKGLVTGTKTRIGDAENWETTTTHYDSKYRVLSTYKAVTIPETATTNITGTEITGNTYRFSGQMQQGKQVQTFNSQTVTLTQKLIYDHAGRLLKTKQMVNSVPSWELLSSLTYDKLGQPAQKKIGNELQTIGYRYNIRGWLTKMNDPDNMGSGLFAMKLNYQDLLANVTTTGQEQYNGNISSIQWTSPNASLTNEKQAYGFTYDKLNRLTGAQYATYSGSWVQSSTYNENGLAYDLNGNILSLKRWKAGTSAADYIDNLTYKYLGNQLIGVRDDATGTKAGGFSDGKAGDASVATNTATWEYTYDKNGNLTKDWNKLIGGITYNHLNLPVSVGFSQTQGDAPVNYIKYTYTASGTKLKKAAENNVLGTTTNTYYFSNFEYGNDKTLMYIHTGEGRVRYTVGTYVYDYYLKDHLGNTREVFTDEDGNSTPEVVQADNYYPFGMRFGQANTVNIAGKTTQYLYNGKELQEDFNLDWYDYGARFYDPALGRWSVIDNKAEKYMSTSPYTYALNNPILFLDPDGNDVKVSTTQNKDGSTTVTFNVTMGVRNSTSGLSNSFVMNRANSVKSQIESSYSGYNSKTNTHYVTNVTFSKDETKYVLNFVNDVDSDNYWAVGTHTNGHNTSENEMQVLLESKDGGTDANQTEAETTRTGAHEYGHTLSLEHGGVEGSVLPNATTPNLMNQSENTTSTDINTKQLSKAQGNVSTNMANEKAGEQKRENAIEQLNQAGGIY